MRTEFDFFNKPDFNNLLGVLDVGNTVEIILKHTADIPFNQPEEYDVLAYLGCASESIIDNKYDKLDFGSNYKAVFDISSNQEKSTLIPLYDEHPSRWPSEWASQIRVEYMFPGTPEQFAAVIGGAKVELTDKTRQILVYSLPVAIALESRVPVIDGRADKISRARIITQPLKGNRTRLIVSANNEDWRDIENIWRFLLTKMRQDGWNEEEATVEPVDIVTPTYIFGKAAASFVQFRQILNLPSKVRQAAELAGISRQTVYNWQKKELYTADELCLLYRADELETAWSRHLKRTG